MCITTELLIAAVCGFVFRELLGAVYRTGKSYGQGIAWMEENKELRLHSDDPK